MNYSFYVGNDMSKEFFDVALLSANTPRKTDHQQFENSEKGFIKLIAWLKEKKVDLQQTFFCLEHTGLYSVPFCLFLSKNELNYSLVAGNEIKESMGITRGKSDKTDAKRIAQYAYKNKDFMRIHTLPSQEIRQLKALMGLRRRAMKAKHAILVSSNEIKDYETDQVSNFVYSESQDIIKQLEQTIKDTDAKIQQVIKQNEELHQTYKLIKSVPGIGVQGALHIIVLTQNFVCFNCPKKFATYAGIAPFSSQSGKSIKSRAKVSPKAHKKMKSLLSGAVANSMKKNAEYRLYFERQIAKGKNEFSVKNALRNKIVSRVFAVIKRGSPYENRHTFAA